MIKNIFWILLLLACRSQETAKSTAEESPTPQTLILVGEDLSTARSSPAWDWLNNHCWKYHHAWIGEYPIQPEENLKTLLLGAPARHRKTKELLQFYGYSSNPTIQNSLIKMGGALSHPTLQEAIASKESLLVWHQSNSKIFEQMVEKLSSEISTSPGKGRVWIVAGLKSNSQISKGKNFNLLPDKAITHWIEDQSGWYFSLKEHSPTTQIRFASKLRKISPFLDVYLRQRTAKGDFYVRYYKQGMDFGQPLLWSEEKTTAALDNSQDNLKASIVALRENGPDQESLQGNLQSIPLWVCAASTLENPEIKELATPLSEVRSIAMQLQ